MNDDAMNKILADQVELGTGISTTAGPVGQDADRSETQKDTDILAFSRTHGAFAGASLDGLGLAQVEDDNAALYDKPMEAREILTTDTDILPVPQIAQSFVKTTEQSM
jgi:lipid-binding SYLF domain-containing protein